MSSDDGRAVANNSPSDTDEVVWHIGTLHDLGQGSLQWSRVYNSVGDDMTRVRTSAGEQSLFFTLLLLLLLVRAATWRISRRHHQKQTQTLHTVCSSSNVQGLLEE